MQATHCNFSINDLNTQVLPQIANLWHCFGYFTVGGIVSHNAKSEISKFASAIYQKRRGQALDQLSDTESALEGSIWEEFPAFSKLLLSPNVLDLIKALLGDQWLYLGSEMGIFSKTSTQAWHRDWNLPLPILKMGYYIYKRKPRHGGEFRIIPGSHRVEDSYASQLNHALAWPTLTQPGGMNGRGFLPKNMDYSSATISKSLRSRIKQILIANKDSTSPTKDCELPHMAIPVSDPTQLLFFDPRTIHSGSVANPPQRRIMIAALFCPNPFDPTFNPTNHGLNTSREAMAKELLETMILDRLYHEMTSTYHSNGLLPEIPSNHLIELDFTPGSYGITLGGRQHIVSALAGLDQSPGSNPKERAWNYLRSKLNDVDSSN